MPNHDAHNDADHQWGGAWGGETAILQLARAYSGTDAKYYAGIGNIGDYPNATENAIESGIALDAMQNVVAAWKWLGAEYHAIEQNDAAAERHVPIDLIGCSRGAMQAVKLASLIVLNGVPDPASEYQKTVTLPNGWNPNTHETIFYTTTVTAYHNFYHPTIRFVSLLSPVYMQGVLDATLGEITFGEIGGLNLGWPTTSPQGKTVILHDGDPTQADPPRHEETITGDHVLNSDPYSDGNGLPVAHGELGLLQRVLDDLEFYANGDDVLVPGGTGHSTTHVN